MDEYDQYSKDGLTEEEIDPFEELEEEEEY